MESQEIIAGQCAKAAWISVSKHVAIIQQQIEVIMLFRLDCGIAETQTTGHAKVHDQCAVIESRQQILATTG